MTLSLSSHRKVEQSNSLTSQAGSGKVFQMRMTAINFNNDEHDNESDANDSFSRIGSKSTRK